MGRRSKLTDEIERKICNGIKLGLKYEQAALVAGISVRSLYNWKEKGEKAKSGKYFQFVQSLKKAEAEGEGVLLTRIHQEAKEGTWQAAAWILERRHPERWARTTKNELTGKDGTELAIRFIWKDDNQDD
jgi:lauroyl/myristoyl acyltransferase